MSHRHRSRIRDTVRQEIAVRRWVRHRLETPPPNTNRLWREARAWMRSGRWERVAIWPGTADAKGFPALCVIPSGRCLWRYDFWMHQRMRRDLSDVFALPPVHVSDARWNKCLAAVVRVAPFIDFSTWNDYDPARLEQWQLEQQRAMWNAFQVPLHLVGLSDPTALERLGDRILGHAVEFVDGPPPDGDTHFTVGRFEDLGKPCLPYGSKRVDVPPFDGPIGPA